MKSFIQFFRNEYLALQSIQYIDRAIFQKLERKDPSLIPSKSLIQEATNVIDGFEADKYNKNKKYLDQAEEVRLLRIYKDDPDSPEGQEARVKIIENKMNYIYAICNRLVNAGTIRRSEFDDAVSEGALGLMKAIDEANIDEIEQQGYGFTPFAARYISGYARNAFNPIRQKDLYSGKAGEVTSMDATISGDRGEWADKDQSLADKIADYNNTPGDDTEMAEEYELLKDFMRRLPDKERIALELYYPANKEDRKSFEEIGQALGGMSKVGARQVVHRAFGKLKEFAKEYGY